MLMVLFESLVTATLLHTSLIDILLAYRPLYLSHVLLTYVLYYLQ